MELRVLCWLYMAMYTSVFFLVFIHCMSQYTQLLTLDPSCLILATVAYNFADQFCTFISLCLITFCISQNEKFSFYSATSQKDTLYIGLKLGRILHSVQILIVSKLMQKVSICQMQN